MKELSEKSQSFFGKSWTYMRPISDKITQPKGQIISKWFFGVFDFLPKTNENKSTWGTIVVKLNYHVRFLEEIEDTKNPIEIIWPLIKVLFCLPIWVSNSMVMNVSKIGFKDVEKRQMKINKIHFISTGAKLLDVYRIIK